ncbi:hypothetical protein ACJX0J_011520, partial [Zea mays]
LFIVLLSGHHPLALLTSHKSCDKLLFRDVELDPDELEKRDYGRLLMGVVFGRYILCLAINFMSWMNALLHKSCDKLLFRDVELDPDELEKRDYGVYILYF